MKLREFSHFPLAFQILIILGKILPRRIGLGLASIIGTIGGSLKKTPRVQALRANQWVIHNQQLTQKQLIKLPKVVYRSSAKCFFDYFYFLTHPEKIEKYVNLSPEAEATIERIKNNEPCIVVSPHISNFDLMGYVLATIGIEAQVLSFPDPKSTYKWQNELRQRGGIVVTPMDLNAFRQARKRLQNGGSIVTGLDRPLEGKYKEKYKPTFFGYQSNLPVTYTRMALEAQAPVFVFAVVYRPDGKYYLEGSPPIWMDAHDNLQDEILSNVQKVLSFSEEIIKKYPEQWAMFYPVWPQFLGV
ncbi:MAG: lipid A biosynthesis lauroyl acyltransferase [bacterium ADurb.BinA186]|nr:MAG: lipid A biosynthesis lauroyl acyltransferase [bacterium ADurb.BinA186]